MRTRAGRENRKVHGWRRQVGAAGARVGAGARGAEWRRGWEQSLGLPQESGSKAATCGRQSGHAEGEGVSARRGVGDS